MTIHPLQHPPQPTIFSSFNEVTNYLRRMHDAFNKVRRGKMECITTVTLTANTTTTTITDERISSQSHISLVPMTANAAAGNNVWWISARTNSGTATITHANNAQTDRTYSVAIIG